MIDASRVQACLRLHATVLWCNTGGWTQLLGAQERCGLPALLSSPVLNTSTYYGIHSLALTDLPCCISTLFPAKDGQICISPVGYAGCKAPASTMTSRSVIASLSSRAYLPGLIPSSMLLPLPGKYMTLPEGAGNVLGRLNAPEFDQTRACHLCGLRDEPSRLALTFCTDDCCFAFLHIVGIGKG